MGNNKATKVADFLSAESSDFKNDTAREFLRRHSNPESLLTQLTTLFHNGDHGTLSDLIQILLEERHPLGDKADIYLLKAKIAFERQDDLTDCLAWIKQARLAEPFHQDTVMFQFFISAVQALRDGLYEDAIQILEELSEIKGVSAQAASVLGHHFLWKSQFTEQAIYHLESTVEARPHFVKAWADLGFAYYKMGQKDKAQDAFARCLEMETDPEKIALYKQQFAS